MLNYDIIISANLMPNFNRINTNIFKESKSYITYIFESTRSILSYIIKHAKINNKKLNINKIYGLMDTHDSVLYNDISDGFLSCKDNLVKCGKIINSYISISNTTKLDVHKIITAQIIEQFCTLDDKESINLSSMNLLEYLRTKVFNIVLDENHSFVLPLYYMFMFQYITKVGLNSKVLLAKDSKYLITYFLYNNARKYIIEQELINTPIDTFVNQCRLDAIKHREDELKITGSNGIPQFINIVKQLKNSVFINMKKIIIGDSKWSNLMDEWSTTILNNKQLHTKFPIAKEVVMSLIEIVSTEYNDTNLLQFIIDITKYIYKLYNKYGYESEYMNMEQSELLKVITDECTEHESITKLMCKSIESTEQFKNQTMNKINIELIRTIAIDVIIIVLKLLPELLKSMKSIYELTSITDNTIMLTETISGLSDYAGEQISNWFINNSFSNILESIDV